MPMPSVFLVHQHTNMRYWYSNSVCPSVAFRYSMQTASDIIFFSPHASRIILVFIACQHTDARYWYSKFVRLSVCPLCSSIRWKQLNISVASDLRSSVSDLRYCKVICSLLSLSVICGNFKWSTVFCQWSPVVSIDLWSFAAICSSLELDVICGHLSVIYGSHAKTRLQRQQTWSKVCGRYVALQQGVWNMLHTALRVRIRVSTYSVLYRLVGRLGFSSKG